MNRYPVAYTYEADEYCTDNGCVLKAIGAKIMPQDRRLVGAGAWYQGLVEVALDRVAKARGIDRTDERSFNCSKFPGDDNPFPKAVLDEDHGECEPDCCCRRYATCGDVIDGCYAPGGDVCPMAAGGDSDEYADWEERCEACGEPVYLNGSSPETAIWMHCIPTDHDPVYTEETSA